MMPTESAVLLDQVSAFLRDVQQIDAVSFGVRRGEAVALLGGNDSGKSLALMVAAGLEVPLTGMVRLLGMDPMQTSMDEYVELRRRIGVVFERPALLSNMSVFNNVALPLRYHTILSDDQIESRVMAALREWGVESFRNRFPVELTFGDARLVAFARALVLEPEILFVDEILFGLDAGALARLRKWLQTMREKGKATLVVSANAPTPLSMMMDRLLFFQKGRLVADCTPADAATSEDAMIRQLMTV
jgi:ABC-type transporter Mla maintaining outer membrane lipid asymmetry ATPase subunit MlaF